MGSILRCQLQQEAFIGASATYLGERIGKYQVNWREAYHPYKT
jgi:hypothetical protein